MFICLFVCLFGWLVGFAWICLALRGFAWLCLALLALLGFACFALLCFALPCFALPCLALPCLALPCLLACSLLLVAQFEGIARFLMFFGSQEDAPGSDNSGTPKRTCFFLALLSVGLLPRVSYVSKQEELNLQRTSRPNVDLKIRSPHGIPPGEQQKTTWARKSPPPIPPKPFPLQETLTHWAPKTLIQIPFASLQRSCTGPPRSARAEPRSARGWGACASWAKELGMPAERWSAFDGRRLDFKALEESGGAPSVVFCSAQRNWGTSRGWRSWMSSLMRPSSGIQALQQNKFHLCWGIYYKAESWTLFQLLDSEVKHRKNGAFVASAALGIKGLVVTPGTREVTSHFEALKSRLVMKSFRFPSAVPTGSTGLHGRRSTRRSAEGVGLRRRAERGSGAAALLAEPAEGVLRAREDRGRTWVSSWNPS